MANWRRLLIHASLLVPVSVLPAGSVAAQKRQVSFADLSERLLFAHNAERGRLGLRKMMWSPALASAASEYAAELAATGKWEHSDPDSRPEQGENLWMGTRGAYTLENMVGAWLSERRMFRRGIFPNIALAGSWHDVGHYTQIIWTDSLQVGCAVKASARYDYLVCRYSAPGNVVGETVGTTTFASN
jgi:hypothetical protein